MMKIAREKHQAVKLRSLIARSVVVVLAIGFLASTARVWWLLKPEHHATYNSPDNRYKLVVRRQPLLFAMPGQRSDAPGTVELINMQGTLLHSKKVSMVQLAADPVWSDNQVTIKLLLDWELP